MPTVDLSLKDKVAIVTGGSKGIGRATAMAYAEHGADVAIVARGQDALDSTLAELTALGGRAKAISADVGSEAELQRIYDETVAELGGVDILVNNAALARPSPAKDIKMEWFEEEMRVNVGAALRLSQLCLESMGERGGGVVINVSSDDALRPSIGIGVYTLAKAALVHLTKLLAVEWGAYNVRSVCISPGLVRTELASEFVDVLESSENVKINPLGMRIGEPEQIAGVALLAASPAGDYMNGGNTVVDGGTQAMVPYDLI